MFECGQRLTLVDSHGPDGMSVGSMLIISRETIFRIGNYIVGSLRRNPLIDAPATTDGRAGNAVRNDVSARSVSRMSHARVPASCGYAVGPAYPTRTE